MILRLSFFLFAIFAFKFLQAQATFVVKGRVSTLSGPAKNASVKASWKSNGILAAYDVADTLGFFSLKPLFSKPDSLLITVSQIGYKSKNIRCFIAYAADTLINVDMTDTAVTLQDVMITGQAMWQKGDTTFFNASQFVSQSDIKLIDLVKKLPFLSIGEDGNLYFKGKIISKITIEGEELFADKIKLMLTSVPLHLLKRVQVLENQSANKMLREFTRGSETYMNLELKDMAKWSPVVGDAEAGAGIVNQYLAKSFLLSLKAKDKAAFIGESGNNGNLKNYGASVNEVIPGTAYNQWNSQMIGAPGMRTIPDLPDLLVGKHLNHFLQAQYNHQFKKGSSKTSAGFYRAENQQQIFSRNSFVNLGAEFTRLDTSDIRLSPLFFRIEQLVEWGTDEKTKLVGRIRLNTDFTHSRVMNNYLLQSENLSNTDSLKLGNKLMETDWELSRRLKNGRLLVWKQIWAAGFLSQQNSGYSPSWSDIFQTNQTSNYLTQSLKQNSLYSEHFFNIYSRKKHFYTPNVYLLFQKDQLRFNHDFFNATPNAKYANGAPNTYQFLKVSTQLGNQRIKIGNQQLDFKPIVGAVLSHRNELQTTYTRVLPYLSVEAKWKTNIYKWPVEFISVANLNGSLGIDLLREQLLPAGITQYQTTNSLMANRTGLLNTVVVHSGPTLKNAVVSLSLFHSLNFNSEVQQYVFSQFVQYTETNLSNTRTGNTMANLTALFLTRKQQKWGEAQLKYTSAQFLSGIAGLVYRNSAQVYALETTAFLVKPKFEWNLLSKIGYRQTTRFNTQLQKQSLGQQYGTLILNGAHHLTKQFTIKSDFNATVLRSDNGNAQVYCWNMGLKYMPAHLPISFALLINNLANNQQYAWFLQQQFLVSEQTVPIRDRFLLVSMRYFF